MSQPGGEQKKADQTGRLRRTKKNSQGSANPRIAVMKEQWPTVRQKNSANECAGKDVDTRDGSEKIGVRPRGD